MIRNQGLHTTRADNNSVTQQLDSVPKPRFVMKTGENWQFTKSLIDRRSDQSERVYYVPPLLSQPDSYGKFS